MFIVQRHYRGVILPAEVNRRVVTGLVPAMRTLLGFTGYVTVDFDRGHFGTFTEYSERSSAEVVCNATPGTIRSMLADLIPAPPVSSIGQVLRVQRKEGQAGFLTLRTYSACRDIGELDRRVGERILPACWAMPGLLGFTLLDLGGDSVASLSLFDTMSNAETVSAMVHPLVEMHLGDLLPHPPETMSGRVLSDIRD